jgi:hypothetical protein
MANNEAQMSNQAQKPNDKTKGRRQAKKGAGLAPAPMNQFVDSYFV